MADTDCSSADPNSVHVAYPTQYLHRLYPYTILNNVSSISGIENHTFIVPFSTSYLPGIYPLLRSITG